MQYVNTRRNGTNGNGNNVGLMIQRCHKWRQNRKKYLDTARTTTDKIERERLFQMAEHYGRMVNEEQTKIDNLRGVDSKELENLRREAQADIADEEPALDDQAIFSDFMPNAVGNPA
ncbi:MAG: hypothetical protein LBB23_00175 [Rickettsiales bacterium]|jgi:hypothetical protein|nr:hypothetical protein [Rickettsiales bacterium]